MIFNDSKPIYLQIADFIANRILTSTWQENARIPSVRELGAELEVNPNTAMRAYEWLSEEGIIFNKRGIGFFVSEGAVQKIKQVKIQRLKDTDLKEIARMMKLLDLPLDEVNKTLTSFLEE